MIEMVKVMAVKALDDHRLWVKFTDGCEGVRDFTDIFAEGGPMAAPLRERAMFARVYIELGVPSWPCGYALDPIALHDEMEAEGTLSMVVED